MDSVSSAIKTLNGVKALVNQLPSINYGNSAIPYINLEGYGGGEAAFNLLKAEFEALDLSKELESNDLTKKIRDQKKELEDLEKKHSSLVSIFGEDGGASEGTLTHNLIKNLDKEINEKIKRRDDLSQEIKTAEQDVNFKKKAFEFNIKDAEYEASVKILEANRTAKGKVRIIEQFSDFLAETNSNMRLYFWVILFLVIGVATAIALSIPDLLACFTSYNKFISSLGAKATSWQILNFAFGILIVKLPWAFCLTAVFTGMYNLLKGILSTYEKINQDKRNISAIYAVSGNIAQALNEYGFSIAEHGKEDDESGEMVTVLRATTNQIRQKRESLKWNQIMNYFEGMQHHKEELIVNPEDSSKLKMVTDLLNKVIDKIPAK